MGSNHTCQRTEGVETNDPVDLRANSDEPFANTSDAAVIFEACHQLGRKRCDGESGLLAIWMRSKGGSATKSFGRIRKHNREQDRNA